MIHFTPGKLKDKSFIRTAHLLPRERDEHFVVALESFSISMLLWVNLCVFVSGQGFHNICNLFSNLKLALHLSAFNSNKLSYTRI